MSAEFQINTEWESPFDDEPEISLTAALISMTVKGHCITRNENTISMSNRDHVYLSAYPLALWFALSWWRLRWEASKEGVAPPFGWRMTHEMPAAGHGFIWPAVTFESDGEAISVKARGTSSGPKEMIIYLVDNEESISAASFERAIGLFIEQTLSRLDDRDKRGTALHALWKDIQEQRQDPVFALARQMEARLGFDPDEMPDSLGRLMVDLGDRAGTAAAKELASGCAGEEAERVLKELVDIDRNGAAKGRLQPGLREGAHDARAHLPWDLGWELARKVRRTMGIGTEPINDARLCEVLGLPSRELPEPLYRGERRSIGLCVRTDDRGTLAFYPRKQYETGKRFEFARFVCESIIAGEDDRWLLDSDAKTYRQKVQRAFAAEWLCPVEGILNMIGSDHSEGAREDAASYYNVSPELVRSLLVNSGSARREELYL